MFLVQQSRKFIDMRIENWFPDKTQSTVPNAESFRKSISPYPWHASHHFYFLVMPVFHALKNLIWWVNLPPPSSAHRIRAMPPTKHAFVATAQGWSCLHAEVRFDAVK